MKYYIAPKRPNKQRAERVYDYDVDTPPTNSGSIAIILWVTAGATFVVGMSAWVLIALL